MTDFADTALAEATARLTEYRNSLASEAPMAEGSGLTVADLDVILKHLDRTRDTVSIQMLDLDKLAKLTNQIKALSDADLLREYQMTDGEPGDIKVNILVQEIERRNLDV